MISHRTLRLLSAVALGLSGLSNAAAEVVFTGTVSPATPGEVGTSDEITVGPTQQTEPGGDPRGAILVDSGTQFEAGRLLVGDSDEALASMRVSGLGTRVHLTSQGSANVPTLGVGRSGSGFLEINDGGWVSVGDGGQGVMTIGPFNSLGVGRVAVRGESSLLTVERQLVIGLGVESLLEVTDAAVVRVGGLGIEVRGTVELSGQQTEVQTSRFLIGVNSLSGQALSPAVVEVTDKAIVRPFTGDVFSPGATIGHNGRLFMDDGVFALSISEMQGLVQGSGVFTAGISINESGLVRVDAGDRIEVQGIIESIGTVRVIDGSLEVTGNFINRESGSFVGRSEFIRSDIQMGSGLLNEGGITLADSTLRIGQGSGAPTRQRGRLVAERSRIDLEDRGQNSGTIEMRESTLRLSGTQDFENQGRLVLEQATISSIANPACCGNELRNNGVLEFRSGQNTISVPVSGGGSLVIGESASVSFGSAEFYSEATVAAGAMASFDDALLQGLSLTLDTANLERASLVAFSDSPDSGPASFDIVGRLTIDLGGLEDLQAESRCIS